jgi:hypothetical protein
VYRRGFNTTHKNKITACAKFKTLIESDRMKVRSKALLSEMKAFVAQGNSYSAKQGDTDDLVMSTLLVVRMATVLKNYDPLLDSKLRDSDDYDQAPMPFVIV